MRAALQVHDPDAPKAPTLWEVWSWLRPEKELAGRAPATLSDVESSLRAIDEACRALSAGGDQQKNPRIISPVPFSCPPRVDEFTRESVGALMRLWRQPGGRARAASRDTIRKRVGVLKMLLGECVDREMLARVPRMPPLPPRTKLRGFAGPVTIEEIGKLYRAADAATWPRLRTKAQRERFGHLVPSAWWRTWLVLWWCYGLRTQDVVAYKSRRFSGLLWHEVRESRACPVEGSSRYEAPHGWLFKPPKKTEDRKRTAVVAPLHPVVVRHLRLFRCVSELDAPRVFPSGRRKDKFYEAWRAIRSEAGLGEDVTIAGSEDGDSPRRSIRKGAGNNWPGELGEWVLGHVPEGTFQRSYKTIAAALIDGIEDLPLPDAFRDDSLLPPSAFSAP